MTLSRGFEINSLFDADGLTTPEHGQSYCVFIFRRCCSSCVHQRSMGLWRPKDYFGRCVYSVRAKWIWIELGVENGRVRRGKRER